jgi:hypothetical protein
VEFRDEIAGDRESAEITRKDAPVASESSNTQVLRFAGDDTNRRDRVGLGPSPRVEQFPIRYEIVTTFVRFHPLFANHRYAPSSLRRERVNDSVTWLLQGDLFAGVHRHHRRLIRKAKTAGIRVSVTVSPDRLDGFATLYGQTMRRLGATRFYFFSDRYWNRLTREVAEHILLFEALRDGDLRLEFKRRFTSSPLLEKWFGNGVHDVHHYRDLTGSTEIDYEGFFPPIGASRRGRRPPKSRPREQHSLMMRCFMRGLLFRVEPRANRMCVRQGEQVPSGGAGDSLMADCRCVYEQTGTKFMLDNAGRFGRSGVGHPVFEDE